ncbi:receptor-like protein EIX2 [Lactuca sativa]|uniref:Leucine-rich repeat-containing N-terminal plant-type domain-containing protein n=1 Tax=Lactuca sativa TaxID=4236 RepID=A0A9R1VGG9_LACSA|nr:receptor-like protein EIX2 [Lactuca sativa]KAJ0204297.1 hypothetical protein LSAT_V11C500262030 [Lactuca sativa]
MSKLWMGGFFLFFTFATTNLTSGCFEKERAALLRFKHSLSDPSGRLSSWNGNNCCNWQGVDCNNATGYVTRLDLGTDSSDEKLEGNELNSSLAELSHLSYIDFSGNYFGGSPIPEFIGSLTKLRYLNLSSMGFSGIVPHSIGNLSNLRVLDLSNMELVVDDFTWFWSLLSLKSLDLSELSIVKAPNLHKVLLCMISSLRELILSGCKLSNSHFDRMHLELNLTHSIIQKLDLHSNLFHGKFPLFLRNLSSLQVLDLSFNELNSSIPFVNYIQDTGICHLKWLDLSHNSMEGRFTGPSTNVSECALFALETLNLNDNQLVGEIPTSLGRLTALRELNLAENKLTGNIPEFVGNLTTLRELNLYGNSLKGSIPTSIRNLQLLQKLDLSVNLLNGTIPFCLGRLSNLEILSLAANLFHGIQNSGIWRLCQLKQLDLSLNFIEGEFTGPSTNVSECAQFDLETLDLSHNNLGGKIPTSLGRLTSLRELNLGQNELTGTIPEALGNLTSLQVLYLASNKLTGSIPTSIGKLLLLRELHLSWNLLNGTMPFSLGRLLNLENLFLSYNWLSALPLSLGNLSKLGYLDISNNHLQGPLPTIGRLSKLDSLDISNNSLSGVVTEAHFTNTSMLTSLDATSNYRLSFKISPNWNPPFQIRNLRLGSCKFESEFPQWIRTQTSLQILILSNTSISGPLPDWLGELPIWFLSLSHNFLNGPLTNLVSNQSTNYSVLLRMLHLKNNLFSGSIPDSLCNFTDLAILDLSGNMLSGTFPDCLGNLNNLKVVILSSNRLSGVIPSSLGNLGSSLRWLALNNNSFHGEFPKTLANCTKLALLDLGENRFFGNIPKWIGENITFLVVLRLHKNSFTDPIPIELCECSALQIMDLGENKLTGSIPRCFQNFSAMTRVLNSDSMAADDYNLFTAGTFEQSLSLVMKGVVLEYTKTLRYVVNIDLSSNKLVGEIPKELALLFGLLGLNLSNNHLTGRIPDRIGDMNSLMSLDLSKNHLSGMIPQSLSSLTFLSHLNLSHNNLSGRIPTGSQLQTLTDPSIYDGNNELCGSPLPINCNHDEVPETGRNAEEDEDDDGDEKILIYGATGGFTTGFMGIVGILVLNNRWRLAFFNFVGYYIGKKL